MNQATSEGTAANKPGKEAAPVLLSACELWHLQTALGEYRDTLLKDLDREPDCRTYREHLQETCSLLDRLADL